MRENEKLLRFVYQNGELLYEEGGDKETAGYHLGAGSKQSGEDSERITTIRIKCDSWRKTRQK